MVRRGHGAVEGMRRGETGGERHHVQGGVVAVLGVEPGERRGLWTETGWKSLCPTARGNGRSVKEVWELEVDLGGKGVVVKVIIGVILPLVGLEIAGEGHDGLEMSGLREGWRVRRGRGVGGSGDGEEARGWWWWMRRRRRRRSG